MSRYQLRRLLEQLDEQSRFLRVAPADPRAPTEPPVEVVYRPRRSLRVAAPIDVTERPSKVPLGFSPRLDAARRGDR